MARQNWAVTAVPALRAHGGSVGLHSVRGSAPPQFAPSFATVARGALTSPSAQSWETAGKNAPRTRLHASLCTNATTDCVLSADCALGSWFSACDSLKDVRGFLTIPVPSLGLDLLAATASQDHSSQEACAQIASGQTPGLERKDGNAQVERMAEGRKVVSIAIIGSFCRSWRLTWPTHKQRVVDVLQAAGYSVQLYLVALEQKRVDGCPCPNATAVRALAPANAKYIAIDVSEVDQTIARRCRAPACTFSSKYYNPTNQLNALRQLYLEERVAELLRDGAASSATAVVFMSDLYLTRDLEVSAIRRSAASSAGLVAFTTVVNDASGYTNGYYIGSTLAVSAIMDRFALAEVMQLKDYEQGLRQAFDCHRLWRLETNQYFLKVRATGALKMARNPAARRAFASQAEAVKTQLTLLEEWSKRNNGRCFNSAI